MIKYKTENTIVRELCSADLDCFVALLTNEKVNKYLTTQGTNVSEHHAKKAFCHIIDSYASNTPQYSYAVAKMENPQILIGLVCYKQCGVDDAEIFIALQPELWGKQIGREMSRGLVDYIFETTKYIGIVGFTMQENKAAKYMVQKLGFIEMGLVDNPIFENKVHLLKVKKTRYLDP